MHKVLATRKAQPVSHLPACRLSGVSKCYRLGATRITALHDLSLTVPRGSFGVVMGPSGSGKSTLLNILGCLEKPDTGTVEILGVDITELTDRELTRLRREAIGFVFQNFSLVPVLTAAENVEYPLILQGIPRERRNEMVMEALAAVGLEDRAAHRPGELSGGQRQRVAIARAVVKRPKLIIADEPTASVDSRTARDLLEMMKRIQERSGATLVVATHDPRVVEYATERWTIVDGMINGSEVVEE